MMGPVIHHTMAEVVPIKSQPMPAHPGRPMLDEDGPMVGPKEAKALNLFRSLRAYRQYLDRVAVQCYEGLRPMADLNRAAAFAKVGAEIFLAENQLARAGLDLQVESHQAGADGGLGDTLLPRGYVEKTVREKRGISKNGAEISETTISATGNANSQELQDALDKIADIL